jgi:D-sedoheptulose 7-phosphate isomerase
MLTNIGPEIQPSSMMDMSSQSEFESQRSECARVIDALALHFDTLVAIADRLTACLDGGGTIYLCGNGGSAADAQHVAAEFVGRFLRERRPLPAIALTCNTSILTAIGNDYDFAQIFARQVRAHVTPRDCVVGISTSGRSPNVLEALRAAREIGACTIGFTGAQGQHLAALCDECLLAPSASTPRIQEAHLLAWHLVCDRVESGVAALRVPASARSDH